MANLGAGGFVSGATAALLFMAARWFANAANGLTVQDVQIGGAIAGVEFNSSGDINAITTAGTSDQGDWITPKSAAGTSGWTVRAHVTAGALTSGTVDTDLALTASRSWNCTQVGSGTKTATLLMTLKDAGGLTLATGTITLTATGT